MSSETTNASTDQNDEYRSIDEIAENPSLEEEVRYPLYWVTGNGPNASELLDQTIQLVEEADEDNLVVVVNDYGDCDGRGTAGILMYAYQDKDVISVPASHRSGAVSPVSALKDVHDLDLENTDIYFTDLAPNSASNEAYFDVLSGLAEDNYVHVRDHHPWPDELVEDLENEGVDIVVDDNDEEPVCASQVVVREEWDEDTPDEMQELADVISIRDLWKEELFEEDTRNNDLSDYAFWSEYGEYEDAVAEHGANIIDDPSIAEVLKNNRDAKEEKIQLVADNASWHEVNGYDVAIAYGNCYSSGAGSELQKRGADLAAIITPTGKVSLRAVDEHPIAQHIAESLGGGGHKCAAGCKPEWVVSAEQYKRAIAEGSKGEVPVVSYRQHWESDGEHAKTMMFMAIIDALRDMDREEVYGDTSEDSDD